jgi:DNA polymerase-3 subunit alpha
VDLRRVNKSVIEALVQCGAMDGMHQPTGIGRDRAFAAVEAAVEQGRRMSQSRSTGQTDMFAMLVAPTADAGQPASASFFPRPQRAWSRHEMLRREKNTLGFYISGHPLDDYRAESARFCDADTASVSGLRENARACVAGVIEDFRERTTRGNDRMAFFALDDPRGRLEAIVRPDKLEQLRDRIQRIIENDTPALVTGSVKFERERENFGAGPPEDYNDETPANAKLVLEDVTPLLEALRARTRSVRVTLSVETADREKLHALRKVLEEHPGNCPVTIELRSADRWSVSLGARELLVDPSAAMISSLEQLFGEKVFELR